MFKRLLPIVLVLAACVSTPEPEDPPIILEPALFPGETQEVRTLVNKWADYYSVPRSLVHRVIQRESDYRASARNGPYWGMMQILPATARNMGMVGDPSQLLDADTALKYSVRYLRGAWMVADGDEYEAMMWYARGFYYEARDRNLLRETGLRGELWQRFDAGQAQMPPIDETGRLMPEIAAAETCEPRQGLGAVLRGTGCQDA
ncbi:MAG: lytic transglycosylase domain-containing protein [Pseudomonadota bacterium]